MQWPKSRPETHLWTSTIKAEREKFTKLPHVRKSPFKITKSFRIYLLCRVGRVILIFMCSDRRLIKPFSVLAAPTSLHAFSRCNIHNLFFVFSISASCSGIARSCPTAQQNPLNHLCKLTRCIFIFPPSPPKWTLKLTHYVVQEGTKGESKQLREAEKSSWSGEGKQRLETEVFAFLLSFDRHSKLLLWRGR